jgi:hypothetical protein
LAVVIAVPASGYISLPTVYVAKWGVFYILPIVFDDTEFDVQSAFDHATFVVGSVVDSALADATGTSPIMPSRRPRAQTTLLQ